jgi:geranylgeranyl pyrophosphate synthase
MYFLPFALIPETKKLISDEKRLVVYETVLHEMINLHVGLTMDIVWHKGLCERVSEKQYLQMCAFKTGGLSRMACKLAALFSGAKPPLVEASGRFGEAIGVAFQIQDDVLNLEGDEGAYGKEIGGDVSEGKRTLMVIHALNNLPARDASRLKEILGMHTKDQKLILEAISLIKKSNSLEYAKKEAKVIVKGAWKELEPQVKESKAKEELRAFADYLIERKY